MIILNLKTYEKTINETIVFARIAKEVSESSGVKIYLAPPVVLLKESVAIFDNTIAQHVDDNELGAFTGSVPARLVKLLGAAGSLINHSEKRILFDKIKPTIDKLKLEKLQSFVCAENILEAQKIAAFYPTAIAIEPPELIGSGRSVSVSKAEIVSEGLRAVKSVNPKIAFLCGAGISNKEDVEKALELGAEGVLLASAFVNSKEPKKFLEDLAGVFK